MAQFKSTLFTGNVAITGNTTIAGDIITRALGISNLITQGSPSSDSTITNMNRFASDLFVSGDGSASNSPKVAGFYLGKSQGDDANRHMDIVSGGDYSYIDFNKDSVVNDYQARLLVNVTTGATEWLWNASSKIFSFTDGSVRAKSFVENGTALGSKYLLQSGGVVGGKLFFYSTEGIECDDNSSAFGFSDEATPCIVNEYGRYISIATNSLDGDYYSYTFPEKSGTVALLSDISSSSSKATVTTIAANTTVGITTSGAYIFIPHGTGGTMYYGTAGSSTSGTIGSFYGPVFMESGTPGYIFYHSSTTTQTSATQTSVYFSVSGKLITIKA